MKQHYGTVNKWLYDKSKKKEIPREINKKIYSNILIKFVFG
jgi:hypothetical protein